MDPNLTSLFIADDHQLFTDGLAALLGAVQGLIVAGTAKTGKELIDWFSHNFANIALIDLSMPEVDGFEASKHLIKYHPQTRIIILSMYQDNSLIAELRKIGVCGYLKKDCDFNILVNTIKKVRSGEYVFEEIPIKNGITPALVVNDDFTKTFKLSSRELEILSLIRKGYSTKEIATQLYISFLTVSTHRKNICHKLNIKTPAGLTRFAIDNNL